MAFGCGEEADSCCMYDDFAGDGAGFAGVAEELPTGTFDMFARDIFACGACVAGFGAIDIIGELCDEMKLDFGSFFFPRELKPVENGFGNIRV